MKVDPKQIQRRRGVVLDVPVGSEALVEPQGVGERFKTFFVGWERNKYIIVAIPKKLELRDHLYSGKLVIVRFLDEKGRICGFESEIHSVIVAPHLLMFLEYPSTLEFISLRKQERADCFVPGNIIHQDAELEGHVLNISKGGCRFAIASAHAEKAQNTEVGTRVYCEFSMLGTEEESYSLAGDVKKMTTENGKLFFGIEFVDPPDDVQKSLDDFVRAVSEYLGGE